VCSLQAGELAERLLTTALKGNSYGVRRGGAYGISALVKGLGIASLKQHAIMAKLEAACASASVPAKQVYHRVLHTLPVHIYTR
jgi:hypothetical protein